MSELLQIPLDEIDPPAAAQRTHMDEQTLMELADSMRSVGLINPLRLRRRAGRYEIVAGHRRYLAARTIGWSHIDAIVDDESEDAAATAQRCIENLQRVDLTPMEEARALALYHEASGLDVHGIARALGRSQWWVENRLALLELDDKLAELVHTGQLAAGAALALMEVDDVAHRHYLAEYAVRSGASVDVLRGWVASYKIERDRNPEAPPPAPQMPGPDETYVVTLPCAVCGQPHDHRAMRIVRVCHPCLDAIEHIRLKE